MRVPGGQALSSWVLVTVKVGWLFVAGLSCARQNIGQHPWRPHTRCQGQPTPQCWALQVSLGAQSLLVETHQGEGEEVPLSRDTLEAGTWLKARPLSSPLCHSFI